MDVGKIEGKLICLLTLLLALPIMSTDIYLPSLKAIGHYFEASPQDVQLTLTLYFILFGFVQLFCGSLSDRFGRRPVMLVSLCAYSLGNIICIFSHTIGMLIGGRCLQSLGAGCSIIVFAVIRDVYEGAKVVKMIAYMSAVVAVSPIIAPIFGGYIQQYSSWQWNFIFLLSISIFLFGASWRFLPETNKHKSRKNHTPGKLFPDYRKIIRNKIYILNALGAAFAFGALFSYISGAPYIFLNLMHYSPEAFGYTFAIAAIGYVFGSLCNGKLTSILSLDIALLIGSLSLASGSVVMVLLCYFYELNAMIIILPQLLCEFGISIIVPISITKALNPIPNCAGAGSAFIGFTRFVFAGLASTLMPQLSGALELAFTILSFGLCSSLSILWAAHASKDTFVRGGKMVEGDLQSELGKEGCFSNE